MQLLIQSLVLISIIKMHFSLIYNEITNTNTNCIQTSQDMLHLKDTVWDTTLCSILNKNTVENVSKQCHCSKQHSH